MQIENPYIQYMYSYPHKTAYRPLKNVDLRQFLDSLTGAENSLYFHVPFCQYKCGYCNLFSLAGQSEEIMNHYVDAMERQAEQIQQVLPENTKFSDLTLGGGTPLILPEHLLERIFWIAHEKLGFDTKGHSVIVETSPNQTTEEKLKLLKEHGITRISIGVQSFQEDELRALTRFHTVETAKKALNLIKQKNFDCLNIDLIYGIPGQTWESLKYSLEQALAFAPEELFIYPLYVKPGTGLYQKTNRSDKTYELYLRIKETLEKNGYHPYSMRRFVKTTKKLPLQTTSLCGFGNTLSIGCGARSYLGNLHFCTPYAVTQKHCMTLLHKYIRETDYLQVSYGFLLNEDEQKRRYVIKHILFGMGISKSDYRQHFEKEAIDDFPKIADWIQQGYVSESEAFLTLTEEGMALSDYLGPQFISPEVYARMKEWKEYDGTN